MVVVARWQWVGGRVGGRLSASGWAHPEGEDGVLDDLQLERLDLLLRHALQLLEGVDGCHGGGAGERGVRAGGEVLLRSRARVAERQVQWPRRTCGR